MKRLAVFFVALCTLVPHAASASMPLVSPRPAGEASVSFDFLDVQTRYEIPTDRFYVSRTILAATWAYESFFASVGYIDGTDYSDIGEVPGAEQPSSDPGYMLAVGARGAVWRTGGFAVNLEAQLHAMMEKVVVDDVRYNLESQEFFAGAYAVYEQPGWHLYAGADVIPYSSVMMKAPSLDGMDRSDFFIGHLGGGVEVGQAFFGIDVPVVGAEGVRFNLGYAF